VNFGQMLCEGQTKTAALMTPGKVVIHLAEGLQRDAASSRPIPGPWSVTMNSTVSAAAFCTVNVTPPCVSPLVD
jgi:hypothetical protein